MTNIVLRGLNWVIRFRHRCGYGVHSPSDFFLITFVIYEKLPFYAYDTLHELRKLAVGREYHREKVDKLLFRLVNYLQPSSLLELGPGNGISTCYMARACKKMKVVTFGEEKDNRLEQFLKGQISRCNCLWGDIPDVFPADLNLSLVHISSVSNYKEWVEKLIPLANKSTCFLISKPYATREKKKWWKTLIADERTGVTFDLYDIGIIFFDKSRIKEHRIINFL